MTTEVPTLNEQNIVRHYEAATRPQAEKAYRADALKAARAGYVAVEQTWTEDEQGFLLAVTYTGPDASEQDAAAVEARADTAPVAEPPTETPDEPAEPAETSEADTEAAAQVTAPTAEPETQTDEPETFEDTEPEPSAVATTEAAPDAATEPEIERGREADAERGSRA